MPYCFLKTGVVTGTTRFRQSQAQVFHADGSAEMMAFRQRQQEPVITEVDRLAAVVLRLADGGAMTAAETADLEKIRTGVQARPRPRVRTQPVV